MEVLFSPYTQLWRREAISRSWAFHLVPSVTHKENQAFVLDIGGAKHSTFNFSIQEHKHIERVALVLVVKAALLLLHLRLKLSTRTAPLEQLSDQSA